MASDPIPGPFHLGVEYRICVTVPAEHPQPYRPITVCTDPFHVELPEWALPLVSLAAGGDHTCGLTDDGVLYCWGLNELGQLGDGSRVTRNRPVAVAPPLPATP